MDADQTTIVDEVATRQKITDQDVLELRKSVFKNGFVDVSEAATLFRLNDAARNASQSWRDFFVEAVVDFLVHQRPPAGYIADEDSAFVLQHVCQDGKVKSETELEALVRAVESAGTAPADLVEFVLRQVKDVVISRGATPQLGEPEITLLRRVLHAGGGDVGLAVSRSEAELLFDVNDLVAGTDADQEAWHDLFAKAVGNHVMAAAGEVVPSRQEALRREQWLKTPSGGVTSFLSRMFGTRGADLEAAFRSKDPFKERHAKMEKSIAESEIVTLGEAKWLKDRIHRDGDLTEAEKALLRFIKDVSPDVSPVLDALISEAA